MKTKTRRLTKVKRAMRKVIRKIKYAALVPVLAAGIILTATPKVNAGPVRGTIITGVYSNWKTPFVGFGLGKDFQLGLINVDASAAISSSNGNIILENAYLSVIPPSLGPVTFILYAYKDRYYNVNEAYGAMVKIRNFKLAGEYLGDGWGDVFAKYAISIGRHVTITPKVIFLCSGKGAEGIGGELITAVTYKGLTFSLRMNHNRWLSNGSPGFLGKPMNENLKFEMEFKF